MAEHDSIYAEFKELVNMTSKELERWLETDESKSVGVKNETSNDKKTSSGGTESTGHESGRGILAVLSKKKSELTDGDHALMKRVNSYVKRHVQQEPSKEDIESSRWRYSL